MTATPSEEHLRLARAVLRSDYSRRYEAQVAQAIADAEERGRAAAVDVFAALFSGGPDTACRTAWLDSGNLERTEHVAVPIGALRQAFVDAGEHE